MRLILTTAALALMAAPALAQTAPPAAPPPPFVPWTVTQVESDAVVKYLSDKPYSFAQPVIDWLIANENKARMAKDSVDKTSTPAPATEPAH